MKKNRWIKTGADMVILLCSVILCVQIYFESHRLEQSLLIFYLLVFVGVLALADLIYQVYCQKRKENIQEKQEPSKTGVQETGRLILLDEEDQPVKSWDIAGRISILIGKSGGEDDVDVDLEDCAFSAFIDYEHAALNFCMEQWYIEDLGSQNGVRVRKADDGKCYKVMGRPCRVAPGDTHALILSYFTSSHEKFVPHNATNKNRLFPMLMMS